ncbi:hypothetical protein B0H10DRAFT_2430724 [Mycena sp. CBHHK59/15]|nr:hypothetical protein B0H10DRAFT_2430724 [Mycena sp. CBHHK59/15]
MLLLPASEQPLFPHEKVIDCSQFSRVHRMPSSSLLLLQDLRSDKTPRWRSSRAVGRYQLAHLSPPPDSHALPLLHAANLGSSTPSNRPQYRGDSGFAVLPRVPLHWLRLPIPKSLSLTGSIKPSIFFYTTYQGDITPRHIPLATFPTNESCAESIQVE